MMRWGIEPMYVARNEEGVIIRVQEEQPADFEEEQIPSEAEAFGNDCPNGKCEM